MFPRSAFPAYGNGDWQIFTPAASTTTTNSWGQWTKPAGCKMIYFYMQAAGGGGGKAAAFVSTAPGGGGSGGNSRLLIPACFLPDVLYMRPGSGGATRTTSGAGNNGTQSYISTRPEITVSFLVMTQAGGSGGAQVTTGGSAGAIGSATAALFQGAGVWVSVAGQAGAAGAAAANAPGANITPFQSGVLTTGGAGGGHDVGAGGSISAGGWLIQAISGSSGASGGAGMGYGEQLTPALAFSGKPSLLFTGGAGGSGNGSGGPAGYGGGGGGAGGSSISSDGNGGAGGDGYILAGAF
jgi:hypothetical protein